MSFRSALYKAALAILDYSVKDPEDDEYKTTPERFTEFMETLLCRYNTFKPTMTTFETKNNEMIVVSPIEFYSLCPHHLALIFGKAYVAYVPAGKVVGLSKIPRLVRWLAGAPIKQEDLTVQIAEHLEGALFPAEREKPVAQRSNGVGVVLRAIHTCMVVRGVQVNGDCTTITSALTGCFLDPNKQARSEFLALVNGGR